MSYKTDFKAKVAANLPDNATKQITASKHREVLDPNLADYVVWADELSAGAFSAEWTRAEDGASSVSSMQFALDSQSTPTELTIDPEAKAPASADFSSLLNNIENGVISIYNKTNKSNFAILKITSINGSDKYSVTPVVNELSTATGEDYVFSFDTSGTTETASNINNYFCQNFAELEAAVISANSIGGGNIYTAGTITFSNNVSWDCTGISFIGFRSPWVMLNSDSIADGTTAKKITITDGDPIFRGIFFQGSASGLTSQLYSNYSSREIIAIEQNKSAIRFENCAFVNVVGGSGSNYVIEYTTALGSGTETELTFDKCYFNSKNGGSTFTMKGITIYAELSAYDARFNVNVLNQFVQGESWGATNTDRLYDITLTYASTTPAFKFYSDGTAYGTESTFSTESENIINQRLNVTALADTDKIMIDQDGIIKYFTIAQLKTELGV